MSMDTRDDEISSLYRAAAKDGPPPALDRLILNAATAAASPSKPAKRWWQNLALPVQLAASVMLVGLVVLMAERDSGVPTPTGTSKETARETLAERPTPPGITVLADASAPPSPRSEPPAKAAPPAAARAKAESLTNSPSLAETRAARPAVLDTAAPPASPAAAPVAAPAVATALPQAEMKGEFTADAASKRTAARSLAGAAAPPAETAPEDWLLRIQKLADREQLGEARQELAALQKAYPRFVVPEALKKRLAP